jgi:hypothetical protein
VLGYALLLLALTEAMSLLGGGGPRAVLSLMNVVRIVVPLVSIVFGTMYLYGAREFTELLAQPVGRRALFSGLYGAWPFRWWRRFWLESECPSCGTGPLTRLAPHPSCWLAAPC